MNISIKKVFISLSIINLGFIVLHLILRYFSQAVSSPLFHEIVRRFDMDHEVSIPTWFAQVLLLMASLLFAYVAITVRKNNGPYVKTWWFLAGLFLYASIDEGAELHEMAIEPMQNLFGISDGIFFFAWVIPGIIIFILLCAILLKFFFHLSRSSKIIFATAVVVLFSAIIVEMISGAYWQAQDFQRDFIYASLNALEEGLENMAFIITIYGLLRVIAGFDKEKLPKINIVK